MPRLIVRAGIQEIYSIRYVKQQWFDLFGGCNEVSIIPNIQGLKVQGDHR